MWAYNETINSNELYHYGVPGMKWGVRRADRLSKKVDTLKNERKKYVTQKASHPKVLEKRLKNYLKQGRNINYKNQKIITILLEQP